jgi:hypothetical protein
MKRHILENILFMMNDSSFLMGVLLEKDSKGVILHP